MINAGFNPLSEISRKTGKSIGVLERGDGERQDLGRDGDTSILFGDAGRGQFHGMTEKMGQTAAGKWSTLLGLAGDLLSSPLRDHRAVGDSRHDRAGVDRRTCWKRHRRLGAAIGWVSEFMQRHATVVAVLGTALGILATSMFLVTPSPRRWPPGRGSSPRRNGHGPQRRTG